MSLKKNIIASYVSQIYGAAVGILMVPLYIRYMGAEAYGLVGFFAMLQVWFNLLDMGLTPTMSRESARFHGGAITILEYRRLARALEGLFGLIALSGGFLLFVLAEPIAVNWLNAQDLSIDETVKSLRLMAVIVALRWMSGFYRGVITGSESLVWLSGMNIAVATGRFVLVLPLFIYISTSTQVYFIFQFLVAVFELAGLAMKGYGLLPAIPAGKKINWKWAPIKPVLKFSMTIAVTSSIWVLVTQTDKLILSKILPLADYGYFTVAVLLASGIMVISGPITSALLPRITRLQAEGQNEELIFHYRSATRLVTMVAIPVTLILSLFSNQVLWAWTGNDDLVAKAGGATGLYAVGYGFLALGAFPYYLQYAKGDLRLHLIGNIIFVGVLIPSVIWAANKYGVLGAGWAWLFANVIYFFTWVPLVHYRFAPGLHRVWLLTDIARVALPSFICSIMAIFLINWSQQRLTLIVELIIFGGFLISLNAIINIWKK